MTRAFHSSSFNVPAKVSSLNPASLKITGQSFAGISPLQKKACLFFYDFVQASKTGEASPWKKVPA